MNIYFLHILLIFNIFKTMEIKNIIESHLDEKMISNIIVDDFINESLQQKHKRILNEFNLNKDDPYTFTNFILKPHLIKIYEDGISYYEKYSFFTEDELYNTEEDEDNFDEDDYSYESFTFGNNNIHRCVIDGSDCGFCNDCRYRYD